MTQRSYFSDGWQGVRVQARRQVRRVQEEPEEMPEVPLRGLPQGRDGPGPGSHRGPEESQVQEDAGEEEREPDDRHPRVSAAFEEC